MNSDSSSVLLGARQEDLEIDVYPVLSVPSSTDRSAPVGFGHAVAGRNDQIMNIFEEALAAELAGRLTEDQAIALAVGQTMRSQEAGPLQNMGKDTMLLTRPDRRLMNAFVGTTISVNTTADTSTSTEEIQCHCNIQYEDGSMVSRTFDLSELTEGYCKDMINTSYRAATESAVASVIQTQGWHGLTVEVMPLEWKEETVDPATEGQFGSA